MAQENEKPVVYDLEWSGEMKFDEVCTKALSIFPDATVYPDNDGQWVVYTNIKEIRE